VLAFRRLWAWLHAVAATRGAAPATFLWNLLQGSVMPGPSEGLLLPLGLARPSSAWRLAAAAASGAIIGGIIAFSLGAFAFESVGRPVLSFLGVRDALLERAIGLMRTHGWIFVLTSTVSPLSTKLVSIAAGAAGMPFPGFLFALATGRITRMTVIATLIRTGWHTWLTRRSASPAP
jgi:membrane protein YqaA with SNARE-associated domain